jgi:hypothetical protein
MAGLKAISKIGLSDSDRGIGLPDREYRSGPGTTVETKKKDKPKTAPAGGGKNPPKNPPKGPTGPKNNDKYGKGNDKNPKKNGYLDKVKKK